MLDEIWQDLNEAWKDKGFYKRHSGEAHSHKGRASARCNPFVAQRDAEEYRRLCATFAMPFNQPQPCGRDNVPLRS